MTVEEEAAAEQAKADEAKKAEEAAAKAKATQGAEETVSKAEYAKLQADLDNFKRIEEERKAKERKRQEELLKEQGKYKELYDTASKDAESARARLAKQDEVFKGMLEAELKDLPEDFDKTLIPAGEPYEQLQWIRKAKPMMVTKQGASGNGREPPPGRPSDLATGMRGIYSHPTSPKH